MAGGESPPPTELSGLDFSASDHGRGLAHAAGLVEVQECGSGIGAAFEEAAVLYANGNDDEALALLEAARVAPTACNKQPWHAWVVTDPEALARLTSVVDKLVVYPERMQKNLDRMGGLVHSQRVLLALTQAGVTRDNAYRLVQRNAMKVWESDGQLSLLELLKQDPEVTAALSPAELEDKFNLDYHFKQVDRIFDRVFG